MKTFVLLFAAGAICASGIAAAQAPADLLKSKNCMSCHDVDKKKVGPSFKDIAAKGGDQAAQVSKLKEGKGHPKTAASDAELKAAVAYVNSQK